VNRKRLEELVGDPRFIPAIHNYCDRWCERCYLSARCVVFAMEQEEDHDPAAHDLQNQAFWDKLQERFQTALDMARDHAQEMGVDLDALDDKEFLEKERLRHKAAKNHPLHRAADRYWRKVDEWMKSHEALFQAKEDQLHQAVRMDPESSEPELEVASLTDAIEVIRWYQYFIAAKLYRAVHHDPEMDEMLEGMPRDCDGSAKIALIALDRSIAAWGTLREALADEDDSILDLLVHLDRLRRRTETEFPQARGFVRPGFDQPVPPLEETKKPRTRKEQKKQRKPRRKRGGAAEERG
jgi:hypothetical protein